MSLISDALEKARREAREREEAPGYRGRLAPARSRSPWPWIAAIVTSLAAGLVIGMLLLRPGDSSADAGSTKPSRSTASEVASPPDVPDRASPEDEPPPGERSPVAPVPDTGESGESAAAPPAQRDSEPAPPENPVPRANREPGAETPPAETEPSPVRDSTAPRPAAAADGTVPAEGAVYHQRVTLPGGAELTLRGIAWHATEPSALLNDQVFGVGDGPGDWTLTAIEPGRVRIEWRGVGFYLALK